MNVPTWFDVFCLSVHGLHTVTKLFPHNLCVFGSSHIKIHFVQASRVHRAMGEAWLVTPNIVSVFNLVNKVSLVDKYNIPAYYKH
jgi:hypothetical protein